MGVKIQLFEIGAYTSYSFRFSCVGMDEKRSLQRKRKKIKNELVARIVNTSALIKQERQDDLSRATRTVSKRAEKCIEVDGGIF